MERGKFISFLWIFFHILKAVRIVYIACQTKCSKPLEWFAAYRSIGLPQTTLEAAGE